MILAVSLPLWLKDCVGKNTEDSRIPAAEVLGQILYQDEVMAAIPQGMTGEDSLKAATDYTESWVKEQLMYDAAKKNIPDNARIEELVSKYRRSLMIHEYQQHALEEKLETVVRESDIRDYYMQNRQRFLSNVNLVKGVFIKVPLKAQGLDQLRSWYCKTDDETIDRIQLYCVQQAAQLDLFYDKWISFDSVLDQIPFEVRNQVGFLRNNNHIEVSDDNYCYLLYIESFIEAGQPEPLEFVSGRIRNILINSQKKQFLQRFEQTMYDEAKRKGTIKIYE